MKLLLENWRQYLVERSKPVQVKFPDVIPTELLAIADKDPEISGFVYPGEKRQRAGIYFDDELVGFMTPRKIPDEGWRVGAIYISPEHRGQGIGSLAIDNFFIDKHASAVPIGIDNKRAQRTFANAGFVLLHPDETSIDKNDNWEYQLWGRS